MAQDLVTSQLTEAASLMFVGMLVVFLFLALLIAAVNGLSWLCSLFPEQSSDDVSAATSSVSTAQSEAEKEIPKEHIAAINAAFAMHLKK